MVCRRGTQQQHNIVSRRKLLDLLDNFHSQLVYTFQNSSLGGIYGSKTHS